MFSAIASLFTTGIDKIFPDANEKQRADIAAFLTSMESKVKVLVAELNGNWLQRSWRPILMLTITFLIFNNYVLVIYLPLLGIPVKPVEIPEALWGLLKLGVSGYVVGRSAEKIMEKWKG